VPIPAPGVQLTSLSHVEDVADMMARVPGNKDAVGQQFNVCTDRCITFDGERAVFVAPCLSGLALPFWERGNTLPSLTGSLQRPFHC
jgi:hypothetical protein